MEADVGSAINPGELFASLESAREEVFDAGELGEEEESHARRGERVATFEMERRALRLLLLFSLAF